MARFTLDQSRVNISIYRRGKEYNLRVLQRAQVIFSNLLNLLPSNYISTVQGPNYTVELKAVAVELSKIELALEDIDLDQDFSKTRSEFLYSLIGYMIFLNGKLPPLEFDDNEFQRFLLNVIRIYFQGSIPKSMQDAADLLYNDDAQILENFLLQRAGASGYDISDQFGFQVQVQTNNVFPAELTQIEQSLRVILDIIRPSHTLFRIRYIFTDSYKPNDPTGKVLDAYRWAMSNYYYEDYRNYWGGVRDRDRMGMKVNQSVVAEDHSSDF